MNVRIYQINMKRDSHNVAFMNYESLPKFQGSSEIDSSLYDKVFEGEVNCFTLKNSMRFSILNTPKDIKGGQCPYPMWWRSLTGIREKATSTFATASVFRRLILSRKRRRSATASYRLPSRKKISVLLVPVGKSPIVKEIPNTYEAMKALVGGGGLDEYMPFEDDAAIVCNRDGKQENLPMNRAVYQPPKRTQMSYSDLKSLFREAENNRQHLTAHIVFTADTFKKPYSEFERTYEVSTDNKAFQSRMAAIPSTALLWTVLIRA